MSATFTGAAPLMAPSKSTSRKDRIMALAYIFTPRTDGEPGAHKDVMALPHMGEELYPVADGKCAQDLSPWWLRMWAETFEDDSDRIRWDGWNGGMFEGRI